MCHLKRYGFQADLIHTFYLISSKKGMAFVENRLWNTIGVFSPRHLFRKRHAFVTNKITACSYLCVF